jgi:hypothetical protein
MKKTTYVRPVKNMREHLGWEVIELTILEALWYDALDYGIPVALYNLWFQVFGKSNFVDAEEYFEEQGL